MKKMKKLLYFISLGIIVSLSHISCQKEDSGSVPTVGEVKLYMTAKDGKDSLVTQPVKGKVVKFAVVTDADICSVWPGGSREVMKKKKSLDGGVTYADSTDMFNHPVLKVSDNYTDYGLVNAKGLKTSQTAVGWYCSYTYKTSGTFRLTVVVSNHGYDGPEYQQVVVDAGQITIK
jgi:hypothetical protein